MARSTSDSGDDLESINESSMMRDLDDLESLSPLPSAPPMTSSPAAQAAVRRSIRDLRENSFSSFTSETSSLAAPPNEEEETEEVDEQSVRAGEDDDSIVDSHLSSTNSNTAINSKRPNSSDDSPLTPKASSFNLSASAYGNAPNTVAAEHSKRLHQLAMPATVAAAEKMPRPPRAGLGQSMALKEQSNLVDRLSKENWGLKMRIHFLDQDLAKLSREGADNMVSENAALKLDVFRLQKDNRDLKKKIRVLESNGMKSGKIGDKSPDRTSTPDVGDKTSVDEADLILLRERIETYEVEIKKLREESIAREGEKRQLAEMVKALNERRDSGTSDVSAREETVSLVFYWTLMSAK